jgi:DNA gyrase subunit A
MPKDLEKDLDNLFQAATEDAQEEKKESQKNLENEEEFESVSSDDGSEINKPIEVISLEDRIETAVLEDEVQKSYLNYAMSVIMSRALPDVRDGMKPVHRRIIYTMHKLGLTPGSKYVKCARIIGEVLGKYHPHGDASVYSALARLAQDFSVRYPLVDGQGNFGSVDGDSPAAMRYTEARMAAPSPYLVKDIEKDTVDFVDNYDGSQREPKVLPAILPNLLINGQTGIAVGMATEIPPHNLQEVSEAILYMINGWTEKTSTFNEKIQAQEKPEESKIYFGTEQNPKSQADITFEELLKFIPGPDLPTGGIIYGQNEILSAYKTGRGRCLLRSKAECSEKEIIVHEIPYQVNKANLLIKISDLIKDKKVDGIRDIRDESNKDGIRIVIETKRDASPEVVLNQLFKFTDLQVYTHFNLVALIQDGRQPKILNLKEILIEFINHRFEVVTRRTQFDLNKAEAELHILDGLKIALDNIDKVIQIIRNSYDKEEATQNLIAEFSFSEKQTEAILQMRLQALTNLDKSKIEEERQAKIDLITSLKEILENPIVKKKVVSDEIREVAEKIKSPRRTQIITSSLEEHSKEDMIEEEEVVVQLTKSQYIKVLPVDTFRTQGRGGRGVTSFNPKDEDWIKSSMIANSHDYIYAFTNCGRVFRTRVFELPSGSRQGRGQALVNYFEFQENESITNILTISKDKQLDGQGSLIFATKQGTVKRTKLELFERINKNGKIAIGLNEGDEVLDVKLSMDEKDKIIVSSNGGKTVIFDLDQLNPLGRTAKGVRGIRLKKGDEVINLQINNIELAEAGDEVESSEEIIESEEKEKEFPSLLVITENGFGKQTKLSDFRKTNRAASGVKTLKMTKKTGKPVIVEILYGNEENLIITTKNGITIRLNPEKIPQIGRSTQGVKAINLDKGDKVVSGGVS